jgi:ribosomal protein S18 acetylase RimI-like enzyme
MDPPAPIAILAAAAANMAAWHSSCLAALGVDSLRAGPLWHAVRPAPFIYLAAITLDGPEHGAAQQARVAALAAGRPTGMGVSDTFNTLDLGGLGFERHRECWFVRPAGHESAVPPHDLRVERVRTPAMLAAFERSQHRGFETPELAKLGTFGVFAPRLLEDPAMHILAIRDHSGEVVSSAMAYVACGVAGIYSVATPPEHRRQGYGEAVTRAAINAARLPAVLQPSAMGEAIYRRMGFEPLAEVTSWIRRG